MEYRLNKIDIDVRKEINDATKEGVIHSKTNLLQVSKDSNQRNSNGKEFKEKLEKYDKNRKIIVKAVRLKNIEIDGYLNEEEEKKITTRGMFLDTKK